MRLGRHISSATFDSPQLSAAKASATFRCDPFFKGRSEKERAMFQVGYLCIIALAALPLARTLLHRPARVGGKGQKELAYRFERFGK